MKLVKANAAAKPRLSNRIHPVWRWSVVGSLGVAVAIGARPEFDSQTDIDHLLASLGRKANIEEGTDRVAKHGSNAVPALIKTYRQTEMAKRWPLVICLCKIPTKESLNFVKSILQEHEDPVATRQAIQRFPVSHEDEITLILVDLLAVQRVAFDAPERLTQMIFRKPSRAGDLVKAMRASDKSMTGRNWEIGEILARVTGRDHTWCCFEPNETDWGAFQQKFWSAWWERNHDKELFDWRVETLYSDPRNDSRKSRALRGLDAQRDRRAIPHFVKALDDDSEQVRQAAILGLQNLEEGTRPVEKREKMSPDEQARIIRQLKEKFRVSAPDADNLPSTLPVNRAR